MNKADAQYLPLLQNLLTHGVRRTGRNGDTFGLFGAQMRFDLHDGFPLLSTKRLFTRGIFTELCWFLHGDSNIKYLLERDVHLWDKWADEQGRLGPVYGKQWRSWPSRHNGKWVAERTTIDQIANVIRSLRDDPYSRRHIVTAWNPAEIEDMALPPCHCLFQFNVRPDENGRPYWLDCQLYQRSGDFFLGVPFNIASYAALTHVIARLTGLHPGDFVHTLGDYHLYANHEDQAREQLSRWELKLDFPPQLHLGIDSELSIDDIEPEAFVVENYRPAAAIKAEVSA